MDGVRLTVNTHDERENHGALELRPACFRRVLRLRFIDGQRSTNSSSHSEDPAAVATTKPWSHTCSSSASDATTGALANAGTGSRRIRRRANNAGNRIAQIGKTIIRQMHTGRHHHSRLGCQLRVVVTHHDLWRGDLLYGQLGQMSLRSGYFVAVSTATPAMQGAYCIGRDGDILT